MSEVKFMAEVNEHKTAIRFEMVINGEVKAGANMSAQQVDDLLRNLALLRTHLKHDATGARDKALPDAVL